MSGTIGQIQGDSNNEYREYKDMPIPTISSWMYDRLPDPVKEFIVEVAVLGQEAINNFYGEAALNNQNRNQLFAKEVNNLESADLVLDLPRPISKLGTRPNIRHKNGLRRACVLKKPRVKNSGEAESAPKLSAFAFVIEENEWDMHVMSFLAEPVNGLLERSTRIQLSNFLRIDGGQTKC